MSNNKFCVVSYWFGENDTTKVWLCDTEESAIDTLKKLWKQSYNLALEDSGFNKDRSFIDDSGTFGVITWGYGGLEENLCRYFEVVEQSLEEKI